MGRAELSAIDFLGTGLNRPESVLATADGAVWCSHWDGGGVSRVGPDGAVHHHLPRNPVAGVRPNGIALAPDGAFLIASLGETGGVWHLAPDATLSPWLTEVDGVALPPTNFVSFDAQGRIWISVSTRHVPRAAAYRPYVADGFVVLMEGGGARIVADGLGYANECLVSPCGGWLYVNETFGRRLSRFALGANGDPGPRQTVLEFGEGIFPDGMAFDEDGGIWIVSIVSNTLLRIAPGGATQTVMRDADPAFLSEVEAAFQAGEMGRPHLDNMASQRLRNVSSLAFAGRDRRRAVLGCLLGGSLATLDLGVRGVEPVHWNWPAPVPETI